MKKDAVMFADLFPCIMSSQQLHHDYKIDD